jgi:hypothetical protein
MPAGARPELDAFIGSWTISTGRLVADCGAVIPKIDMTINGMQTVERGTDSDLLFDVQPTCRLKMDASGQTATVRANQTCQLMLTGGFTAMGTVTGGSMILDGMGGSTFKCDGSAAFLTATCTFDISGTSTKTP